MIGFGAWGKFHARAIAKTKGVELKAIAGRTDTTCQAARDAFPQVDVHANYQELIQRDDLDVVDIVIPNRLHHEVACAALQAGKHLLLEKPMAVSI